MGGRRGGGDARKESENHCEKTAGRESDVWPGRARAGLDQLASPGGDTFLQDTHWDTPAYHGAVRDALLVWRSWFSLETLTDLQ